jgi:ribosome-associated protein
MARIAITSDIAIDDSELEESFMQATGPGGQNVNKVATAVQLRFDAQNTTSLPDAVRRRLLALAGKRLTKDGVLVLTARQFRTQERNRADARARLVALLQEAADIPIPRRPTRPPRSSKKKRLEQKGARGQLKRWRAKPTGD